MHFDFSAVDLMVRFWHGQVSADEVLAHPAYRTAAAHAARYGEGLYPADLEAVRNGESSRCYGTQHLVENLPQIATLLAALEKNEETWLTTAETELRVFFPMENLAIPIYPILGYDMGIGLNGVVCMNCNTHAYLRDAREFLLYAIHEIAHVVYERYHPIPPPLAKVLTPADWRSYFTLWLQNEGFAVYAPLKLRQAWDCLADQDYRVLLDPAALEQHRLALLTVLAGLDSNKERPREEFLELCFGEQRLSYRLGCELFRRIETCEGLPGVRRAFALPPDGLFTTYGAYLHST